MALFGLNWEESKWPGHFCSKVLNFFASKIGVKLSPRKKVPWRRCWALLSSRWKSHFSQKDAFFGQKKALFQKVHFIQMWSVTPNTIFECIKNDFLLSNPKIVFLTEFNLIIVNINIYLISYVRILYLAPRGEKRNCVSFLMKNSSLSPAQSTSSVSSTNLCTLWLPTLSSRSYLYLVLCQPGVHILDYVRLALQPCDQILQLQKVFGIVHTLKN